MLKRSCKITFNKDLKNITNYGNKGFPLYSA